MGSITRPVPAAARDYAFPKFERHELANGLKVLVAPVHKLPIVTISVVVDAGAEREPVSGAGLAQMTAHLLTEGAGSFDAAALTERMELLGSSLSAKADWDSTVVTMSVMSQRFKEALETLSDVLMHPALPERELKRLKGERQAEILQTRAEPRSLADERFEGLIYDTASRYSLPLDGSEATVNAITLDNVRAFHEKRFSPKMTTIVVAGDISAAAVVDQVQKFFGDWKGGANSGINLNSSAPSVRKRAHLVIKEGAPQSELRIGHIGVPRLNPDYFSLTVANAIFGGLFSSRINLNLRERHGYTYGAFSHFDWRRQAGPFVISTAVKSEVTIESIKEILSEISRIREEPVSEDELSLAVNYLAGVFPIRFETTSAIASALSSMVVYGLPVNYFDVYRSEISAVTKEKVMEAARKYLKADQLEVVIVGDPAVVRDDLTEFAAGHLGVHAADGSLLI